MLFVSPVFLFLFLPILFALYFLIPRISFKNAFLLFASLFFYAWGETFFVLIMVTSIGMNYTFGLMIDKWRGNRTSTYILVLAIATNLGLLGYFKYANFFIDNINSILPAISLDPIEINSVHLPLGISFFTFQAMSYIIDIYRNEAAVQKSIMKVALYISLFPQLIAGPIVRYQTIAKTLTNRFTNIDQFSEGTKRFIIGLSKKMLIANPMGAVADQIFAVPGDELSTGLTWLGAVCYTLQIYFDFAGYSDMAIGLGRMFGFRFPENFNYPYISRSITEFWRRWHISLSTWFRDYLYISMGGNRGTKWRTLVNAFTVFALCGLWHGASWTFVIWGLFHGAFIVMERIGLSAILEKLWKPLSHIYLLFIVMIGWVFFRADNIGYAGQYLGAMFGFGNISGGAYHPEVYIDNEIIIVLSLGILLSTPIYPCTKKYISTIIGSHKRSYVLAYSVNIILLLSIGFMSIMAIAADTYNPFIYFRF